ncbi:ankyrin repeat-containing domain protein [Halteromyces radiatus]|uniref:ankyrin repeat-containing domain protein n=1 Tax=Halteromyces radiatus TaxID=101107 RepID=UPI00221F4C05|nr:ankyrin repeat-containing domain protein [Halteromyces radiatus]KAI8093051.1 ankyrin repeat-containing domain protein [Halteromyces radiatus]
MFSENITSSSPSSCHDTRHIKKGFQQLPAELLVRIFILAQNPELRLVMKTMYGISKSTLVRAQFLIERFGRSAALGERGMKSFRMASTVSVVDHLLKFRCDPRSDGDYLVWQACEQNNVPLFILVVDAIRPDSATLDRYLNRVAMMSEGMRMVDILVKRYGASIHHGDDTMMMLACAHHNINMVQHLISRYGCDPHFQRERYLRRACLSGSEALVTLLLPGADIHCFNDAALQNAAFKQHSTIVDLLLKAGADPHANRNASLLCAVQNNDLTTIQLLLAAGADPRCRQDEPLRLACRHGDVTTVDCLIHATDRVQDMVNCGNGMPLYEALVAGHATVTMSLLSKGADANSPLALHGLQQAILLNHLTCVQIMANAGAMPVDPSSLFDKPRLSDSMRSLIQSYFM